ncbi:Hypothetical Protein FCC1311_048232 [Hondaea fermentalgiana]|uniref:Uncharacterized protein n=1 Tax=Hondaea fermentalgiana TaxID=2315210 RepID=A0A2R5GC78_9STRA|nr:Hypothetical Protein FCC1311_048232 [Hondaea fermentalgiana]|eukprot:GBG28602.1 Hypothetical Protein FCC1311_048232 [Hondaea fermentalgiana]
MHGDNLEWLKTWHVRPRPFASAAARVVAVVAEARARARAAHRFVKEPPYTFLGLEFRGERSVTVRTDRVRQGIVVSFAEALVGDLRELARDGRAAAVGEMLRLSGMPLDVKLECRGGGVDMEILEGGPRGGASKVDVSCEDFAALSEKVDALRDEIGKRKREESEDYSEKVDELLRAMQAHSCEFQLFIPSATGTPQQYYRSLLDEIDGHECSVEIRIPGGKPCKQRKNA